MAAFLQGGIGVYRKKWRVVYKLKIADVHVIDSTIIITEVIALGLKQPKSK